MVNFRLLFVVLVASFGCTSVINTVYADDNTTSASGSNVSSEYFTVNQDVYFMGCVGIGTTEPSDLLGPKGASKNITIGNSEETEAGNISTLSSASAQSCADISGDWSVSETGVITCILDEETVTEPVDGTSTVTIYQDGCNVGYDTPTESGPVSKTGTVSGNDVYFSGIFMMENPSCSFTENISTASGTVNGNNMILDGLGTAAGNCDTMSFSCTSTTTAVFSRIGIPPTAFFTYSPANPQVNEAISFYASASSDSDGYVASYNWDFGDGRTAQEEIANYSYSQTGTYTVKLTVTDNDGLIDSTQKIINVEGNDPVPNIRANGSDGPITLVTGDNLSVTVELDSGDKDGENADWWVAYYNSSSGWFYYDLSNGWINNLSASYQGPLFDLGSTEIFNTSSLDAGTYTFYFGVDLNMNGILDTGEGQLYYDLVNVTVTESAPCSDYTGNWSGTYFETYCDGFNYSGTWTAVVTSDCSITAISDEGDFYEGTITGNNVSGSGFDPYCGTVSFVGTISENSMSGTYTYSLGGSGSFDGSKN